MVDELRAGQYPDQDKCLTLIAGLPMLHIDTRILEVAEVYQVRKFMPRDPVRDAVHVALASCYRLDFLLTWNCRHLANANKMRHLEVLNQGNGPWCADFDDAANASALGGRVMQADSVVIEQVRRRAHEISARFDHDLHKYAAHLLQIEREFANRVVNQVAVIKSPDKAAF